MMALAMRLQEEIAELRDENRSLRKELKSSQKALDNALDNLDAEMRKNGQLRDRVRRFRDNSDVPV